MGIGLRHEKAEMILRLALMMQANRSGISLQDIMDEFELSRRTAERMRDAVERVFPQMEEMPSYDRVKRWRIPSGTFSQLFDITSEQLSSLSFAIDVLNKNGQQDKADQLMQLNLIIKGAIKQEKLNKIEPDLEAMTLAEGIAARPGPKPDLPEQIMKDLRHAVLGMNIIRLKYKSRDTGKISTQTIHPYGFLYGQKSYLVAFSPNAKAMRLWLISGIESVNVQQDIFNRDENFNLHTYASKSFGVFQEDPVTIELEFISDVADDVANFHFHGTQEITRLPNGKIKVTFTAGGLTEICWHLFTWGTSVKIIKPIELKNKFETMCKEILGE